MTDRSLLCLTKHRGHICVTERAACTLRMHHCLCGEAFIARHEYVRGRQGCWCHLPEHDPIHQRRIAA